MNAVYKIRKAFRYPFVTLTVLLFVLFLTGLARGECWEKILTGALFAAALVVAVESSEREFGISENGLRIRKFFRTRHFTWAEITHLGTVILRSKAYFLLTTTKGFYLFSNLLQDHTRLLGQLAEKLEDERVETEIKNYIEAPKERTSLIVLTWVALVLLVAVVLTRWLAA
ncbi:MAG: hypothetical protein PHW80_08130 [Smithellaceae bacterium]|nr:hypothetical protein [Smithellaceae bacterium]MDD3259198.1 hypothetical protein [Smithellaceae bacterium]MDD3849254.1 hypothetical protein [Smithellaceae bacterium]HOG12166.1 hypothetical protein [Smithellaceae bacterium]HOQ71897.1 hypothetical protein [Smithellaceae bacterium]